MIIYSANRITTKLNGGKMELKSIAKKKSIMGPVISVFVMVLVISILAGLTFLFVSQLKTQVENTAEDGENSTAYQAVNDTDFPCINIWSNLNTCVENYLAVY